MRPEFRQERRWFQYVAFGTGWQRQIRSSNRLRHRNTREQFHSVERRTRCHTATRTCAETKLWSRLSNFGRVGMFDRDEVNAPRRVWRGPFHQHDFRARDVPEGIGKVSRLQPQYDGKEEG